MTASMDQFRDVTLRDGLQLTGKLVDAESKVALIRRLFGLGVQELEIGSMARPDLVPPLANTTEVISLLSAEELAHCWIWVAVPRQLVRAADAGATRFQFCFSASESHNEANVNRSVQRSLDGLAAAVLLAKELGATVPTGAGHELHLPVRRPDRP